MKIFIKIVKTLMTLVLIMLLVVIIVQRVSKNNFALGGFRVFLIVSESMAPDYLIGDILLSRSLPSEEIELGDRVTYLGKEGAMRGIVVTHTVIDMREENGKHFFTTQGLQNDVPDPEISEDDIYGKIVYKTIVFSFFGRLMNNAYAYYGLFLVIGLLFSYQVISGYILNKRDDDEEEEEKLDMKKKNTILDEELTNGTEVISEATVNEEALVEKPDEINLEIDEIIEIDEVKVNPDFIEGETENEREEKPD